MSKCCWKNGADRLALRTGATDLQSVNTKLLLPVKHNKSEAS